MFGLSKFGQPFQKHPVYKNVKADNDIREAYKGMHVLPRRRIEEGRRRR